MNFGGRQDKKDSIRIIHQALEAGINFIDTANVYGHEPLNFEVGRGRSEQIVGEALQAGKRKILPFQFEIMTSISGATFEECYPERVAGVIDNVEVQTIGLSQLKANKQVGIRPRDAEDFAHLR